MNAPDEYYTAKDVTARLTEPADKPEYGAVSIVVRFSERQSSSLRLSRKHAADLMQQLITVLAESKPEQPDPAVGQVWRNKSSDRLVRVAGIYEGYNAGIRWEALSGRGPKQGKVWPHYFPARFEFISDSEAVSS